MQITESKIQHLSALIFILVGVLVWVLMSGDAATAASVSYADSAHGDTVEGVNRLDAGYPTGDCAHCHDSKGPDACVNELMLFAPMYPTGKQNNFCLRCHRGSASVQDGGITNNDYGATFGGGTPMFNHIRAAFNVSGTYVSSHTLGKVRNYARDNADWGSWVTDDTNACLVCHDVHRSRENFPVEINGNGGVKTAVRRGNDVNDYPGDLWGDEPYAVSGRNEMMADWTTGYQAPLRGDSGYEPGPEGSTIQDGSNLPNFVSFCAQTCHRLSVKGHQPVNWQDSSSSEWPGDPSTHGKLSANGGGFGVLKPPYGNGYDSDNRGNYVLSCTDCHEPHGSTNSALLRTTVNGVSGLQAYDGSSPDCRWTYFCEACHEIYPQDPGDPPQQHPVIWPEARCGQYVGCHMSTGVGGVGGNHGYQF